MLLILVATTTTFGSTHLTLCFRNDSDENQVILLLMSKRRPRFNERDSTLLSALIETGTFKFIYEGERLQPQDTPASVRQPTPTFPFDLTHGRIYQHEMESGDIIDAHLEQVRTGVTSPVCTLSQNLVIHYSNSSEAGIDVRMPLLFVL